MKKTKSIHNLETLEKEIYRLKLATKNIEAKLDSNLDHLQENYWSMTMDSFFCKDGNKKDDTNSFRKNFFKNEDLKAAANTIAGNIADKASKRLYGWLNSFFGKNNH